VLGVSFRIQASPSLGNPCRFRACWQRNSTVLSEGMLATETPEKNDIVHLQAGGSSTPSLQPGSASSRRASDSPERQDTAMDSSVRSSCGMAPTRNEASRFGPWGSYIYPAPPFLQQGIGSSLRQASFRSVPPAPRGRDVGKLQIKNTFLDYVTPRSWEEFYHERKVRSCPASVLSATTVDNLHSPRSGITVARIPRKDSTDNDQGREASRRPSFGSTADEAEMLAAPPILRSISAPSKLPPPWRRKQFQATDETVPLSAPLVKQMTISPVTAAVPVDAQGMNADAPSYTPLGRQILASLAAPPAPSLPPSYCDFSRQAASSSGAVGLLKENNIVEGSPLSEGWRIQGGASVASEFAEGGLGDDEGEDDDYTMQQFVDTSQVGTPAVPTIGSLQHPQLCKPCAFVGKGCDSGTQCRFCHLCEAGEKKRRKKEKLQLRREQNRWKRTVGIPYGGGWKY